MEKNTVIEDNKKLSNQLGYYIGEYIVRRFLPTLSCDILQSFNVINITKEEQEKYDIIDKKWFNKTFQKDENGKKVSAEVEWNELQKYRKFLTEKYIPKTLDCHIPVLEEKCLDMEEFKSGVGVSLWDCDMSYYKCDPSDIKIFFTEDKFDFPYITLVRG